MPVVSGAHADHWEAFRVLGIDDPLPGNGRLMESLRSGVTAPAAAIGLRKTAGRKTWL